MRNENGDAETGRDIGLRKGMRVVIVDLKRSYGIERMSMMICQELRKYCDSVTIIAASESQLPDSIKLGPSAPYRQMLIATLNPLTYVRVFRHLSRLKPDVVYVNSPHTVHAVLVVLCRLFTNICVIAHVHDTDYDPTDNAAVAFIADTVALIQCWFSHRVYCCGQSIRDRIVEKFHVNGNKINVFRLGPQQATYCDSHPIAPPPESPRYFAQIGTIQERKGIEFFLRAAIRFNQIHGANAVQFVLGGKGDVTRYRELCDAIPNLTVRNTFLSDDEVNEILVHSYALVLPYLGGMMQSSFVSIAYGNCCPVIVTRNGGMHEEVRSGETGYIVDKRNSEQIEAAMTKIYAGKNRESFARACMQYYTEKFSWDVIGEQIYRDMESSSRTCGRRTGRYGASGIRAGLSPTNKS